MNILFTCAGRRNYLINYFKEALNGEGQIIATDADPNSPALEDADIGIVMPFIKDPNYKKSLKRIVRKYNIDAVISLNDRSPLFKYSPLPIPNCAHVNIRQLFSDQ